METSTSQLSAEYLAGFFDGEGYVGVERLPKQSRKFGTIDYYRVKVSISNTDLNILKKHQKQWGGRIDKVKRRSRHKQAWCWTLHQNKVKLFLQFVYPHCHIKKSRIASTLQLLDTYVGVVRGRHYKPNIKLDQKRFRLYKKCKTLNKRGDELFVQSSDLPVTKAKKRTVSDYARKYSPEIVAEIRRRYITLAQPASQIEKDMGVKKSYVYSVATGRHRLIDKQDKKSFNKKALANRPKKGVQTHCSRGHKYDSIHKLTGWNRCKTCAHLTYLARKRSQASLEEIKL